MGFLNGYSQNFLAGSFVVGNYRLVGRTTGILYVVTPAGNKSIGKGRPIGADREKRWSLPEFDWEKDTIRTKHIKVKWMVKPIEVDVIYSSSSIEDSDIRAWAGLQGYKQIKFLNEDEVQLLD